MACNSDQGDKGNSFIEFSVSKPCLCSGSALMFSEDKKCAYLIVSITLALYEFQQIYQKDKHHISITAQHLVDHNDNLTGLPVPDHVKLPRVGGDSINNPVFLVYPKDINVNWLDLPDHLTSLVAEKLVGNVRDLIVFSAVCTSWHSVYIQNLKFRDRLPRQLPYVMLPTEFDRDDQTRSCYSISSNKLCGFHLRVPQDRICHGSSYGWLVTVHDNLDVSLLNPFLSVNNEIHLPPLSTFQRTGNDPLHNHYMIKAVLSANPSLNPNYVVTAIHGDRKVLAFWRPGDTAWTSLDIKYRAFRDLVYYRDQFYAVDNVGVIFSFDANHPHPKLSVVSPSALVEESRYIVESSGDLLQVLRDVHVTEDGLAYFTRGFQVFKLLDSTRAEWVEVKSLDGRVLFLGDNTSMSLLASDFPGCKPDCIYFTDDYHEGYFERVYLKESDGCWPHEMGVFNINDGSIKPFHPVESDMILPPPIWIEPAL